MDAYPNTRLERARLRRMLTSRAGRLAHARRDGDAATIARAQADVDRLLDRLADVQGHAPSSTQESTRGSARP